MCCRKLDVWAVDRWWLFDPRPPAVKEPMVDVIMFLIAEGTDLLDAEDLLHTRRSPDRFGDHAEEQARAGSCGVSESRVRILAQDALGASQSVCFLRASMGVVNTSRNRTACP